MNLFLIVSAVAAFAHGPFPTSVCDATCYFHGASGALERRTVIGTGVGQTSAWKQLGAACQKLGKKGELQIWNPKYDNNSSAEPEFFAATPENACSALLPLAAAFAKAQTVTPDSGEQKMQLGNYRVTYASSRKVSPTQTIAQQVQISKNGKLLYAIDKLAASVLLEKYGEQISVVLQGATPGAVLSKQVISMNGIKSHCHEAEVKALPEPVPGELRNYLRSLHCVK